ncbi:hypothetical protein BHE74_00040816 [Ensete ventricosum]|nr:hypothetical protein BHE74_00040816 [Ensete ventricosum]
MELTKGAADNYHHSWWRRHGVVLDGEIAALYFKNGNYDLAAKSYEKVCALYAGEGWQDLLAEVLPNLAECQKILSDEAGYLSSCVRLLSLENGLFLTKERQAFQSEVVHLAHSEMEHPVPLDVSSLITFSGNPGPPLELCDGDPAEYISYCSFTYVTSFFSQVLKPRPLVDIAAAVSSALLMNEIQWLGLIVKPIKYSLKGALLSIDTGPGLMIDESHMIEIDDHVKPMEDKVHADELDITKENAFSTVKFKLVLENGKVALPDWASDITTVLWFPVRAIDDRMAVAASAVIYLLILLFCLADQTELLQTQSILNIMYGISGDRTNGAHAPASLKSGSNDKLHFKVAIALQRPVLDPCVAVGFIPFSSDCLRVGQLVSMKWRVERLKDMEASNPSSSCNNYCIVVYIFTLEMSLMVQDEVLYEVDANPEIWMIAGRKRGHISLSNARGSVTAGSRIEIIVTCMPLISGHVRPPHLGLPGLGDENISCNPAGPHLVCVLPPTLSSSYCTPA